jgi:hypothetical protein
VARIFSIISSLVVAFLFSTERATESRGRRNSEESELSNQGLKLWWFVVVFLFVRRFMKIFFVRVVEETQQEASDGL